MSVSRFCIIFCPTILFVAWFTGLQAFVHIIPKQVDDTSTPCDAIVVLTGGSKRVHEALSLLNEKRANSLFISGIGKGADLGTTLILSGNLPDNILDLVDHIELGFEAENTRENAKEIATWARKRTIHSLRLVTSNYHTPRSLLELKSQMPGVTIIPHPVFPGNVRLNEWWRHTGTLSLVLSEYHKYMASQMRIFLL
jgi:uncharacterized SAM-binding protein YcdF (DUF218 family)